MQFHRAHHAVASLNGLLYSVGGLGTLAFFRFLINSHFISFIRIRVGGREPNEEQFLSSVEVYDPMLQRWIPVAPMHEARAYCGVATVGSYLYAIGGFNGTSWLRSMEKYCPLTNQWTLLTPM